MKIDKVREKVQGLPHMTAAQADEITQVILENKFQNILELGFAHGVSTCFMAGALDELGGGHITTIDLEHARNAKPNIDSLLNDLGLAQYVTVYYEPTSYLWRLMKMLEEDPTPRFDFCYLDGAHDWATDGFAFFLVDKLLKPGGMIILDDLDWTLDESPAMKNTPLVKNMPVEEKRTPQVRKIYELLVKTHPGYSDYLEKDRWAYARKLSVESYISSEIRKEIIYQNVGLGSAVLKIARRVATKL